MADSFQTKIKEGSATRFGSGFGGHGLDRLEQVHNAELARQRRAYKTDDQAEEEDEDKAKTKEPEDIKVFAKGETIFTETFWSFTDPDQGLLAKWQRIREVREAVNKEIENLRSAGAVGSSLQANVALGVAAEDEALLRTLGDDLKFVLITSKAEVAGAPVLVLAEAVSGPEI